jgi:ATPase subunit of ABC transporter with duplicated ATPase domains
MPSICLSRVSLAHGGAAPLLEDVTLHLGAGWTGIVGENGLGKTSLLRLISGDLEPVAGHVRRDPPELRVTLCAQEIEHPPVDVDRARALWSGPAQPGLARLRVHPSQIQAWSCLSPGERKRWQIAAALADEPDALLLDEPTNHLDREGRALLVDALRRFRGIGIVVTHDRALLDELTERTVRLAERTARLWSGPYSQAREGWRTEEEQRLREWSRLAEAASDLRERLQGLRESSQRAERRGRRVGGKRLSDESSLQGKGRALAGAARMAREAGRMGRELEGLEEAKRGLAMRRAKGRSVRFEWSAGGASVLARLVSDELGHGEAVILREVSLSVLAGTRIWLQGANGSGKSTLLGALLRAAVRPSELLHLPQELLQDDRARLLEGLGDLGPEPRGRLLQMAAALGLDPQRLVSQARLSPGEGRKLLVALGISQGYAGLFLDEPTNHLDLPSIERLEEALADYPGALVLVTHDERLTRRTTSEVWRVEAGRVVM